MDLSNARIIEWESTEERGFEITCLVEVAHVARRERRGAKFREGGTYYTEEHAAKLGARVVAEFPRPSLAEIVGDAPAFLVTDADGEPAIAYRIEPGDDGLWHLRLLRFGSNVLGERPLHAFDAWGFDPSSVVPLVPREVVS